MGLSMSSAASPAVIAGSAVPSDSPRVAQESGTSGTDVLFSTLYGQLHSLARRELARRIAPSNLSVTTLLHEAYLDISQRAGAAFADQPRFVAYAARVMRGIIIDHARSRSALKRGGEFEFAPLATDFGQEAPDIKELSEIGDALDELLEAEPELAEVVELKFFCGCSFAEIAALQKLSERTVQRKWEKARMYLRQKLAREIGEEDRLCQR
jgi:RNA polymerase sigma factor (TIGR02999 family)